MFSRPYGIPVGFELAYSPVCFEITYVVAAPLLRLFFGEKEREKDCCEGDLEYLDKK